MNVRYFPYDRQNCRLELGPWSSTIEELDVKFLKSGESEVACLSNVLLDESSDDIVETIEMGYENLFQLTQVRFIFWFEVQTQPITCQTFCLENKSYKI